MGIPIDPKQTVKITVDEVVYGCRPAVGSIELDVWKLAYKLNVDHTPYIEKAAQQIEKELKGKRHPKKEKKNQMIQERASQLASEVIARDDDKFADQMRSFYDMVNLVLVGWESDTHKLPKFPENGKPAEYLRFDTCQELANRYIDNMNLSEDEQKNL
jgi:hypothetical protein